MSESVAGRLRLVVQTPLYSGWIIMRHRPQWLALIGRRKRVPARVGRGGRPGGNTGHRDATQSR